MVTKYDVFEVVYSHRAPVKPIEILRILDKNEKNYNLLYKKLQELLREGLVRKTAYGFEASNSKKAEALYDIIHYCLNNDINYNYLLDKNLVAFLSEALQVEEITSKNVTIQPRTLKKYIETLDAYGLLMIRSRKPLRVKIFYNILLNNLLVYFSYKHKVIIESKTDYIKEIKKELMKFNRLLSKNRPKYKKIIEEFEIFFVHHSLSLEGNPIARSDTIRILKDKIIPKNLRSFDVDELKNYQEAINQMIDDTNQKKLLNISIVLTYHKLAMNHLPRIAGKIRNEEVFIKGNPNFKITKPEKIRKELDLLFEKYNDFIKKRTTLEEILKFAVFFHNEFQHIHPFFDGNSRTTRLITFHLLQSKEIPILDIPLGLLDEYISYTKGSKKRDDNKLLQNLQKIILYNLKKINDRLKI